MSRELTKDEYLATFDSPMRFIGLDDDSFEPVPIGDYVGECIADLSLPTSRAGIEIHQVYANPRRPFVHVLLNWGERNIFLVVVTDIDRRSVVGHIVLDLNAEYGLYDADTQSGEVSP